MVKMIAVFLKNGNQDFIGTYEDGAEAFETLREFLDETIAEEQEQTMVEAYDESYFEIDLDNDDLSDRERKLLEKANLI